MHNFLMDDDVDVRKALDLIASVPLTPQEQMLLSYFVKDSVDPKVTALYVLRQASQGVPNREDAEFELRHLVTDWKQLLTRFKSPIKMSPTVRSLVSTRDNGCCCITKRSRKWWDVFGWSRTRPVTIIPPAVVNDLDSVAHASIRELLALFIIEDQLQRLIEHIGPSSNDTDQIRNTWILDQKVAAAFETGQIFIQLLTHLPQSSTKCKYEMEVLPPYPLARFTTNKGRRVSDGDHVTTCTDNPGSMPLPSSFLFSLHACFCMSLRWRNVEDQMLIGWPENKIWRKCQEIPRRFIYPMTPIFRKLWPSFPERIRAFAYRKLLIIGTKICGRNLRYVQRVPFGIYIKHGSSQTVPDGEAPGLRLVEQHTDIPAPKLMNFLTCENHRYLVMTRLPGMPLLVTLPLMTSPERAQLAVDLRTCISKLRRITNLNASAICNANGGPLFDHRFPSKLKIGGPFQSEEEFNNFVVTPLHVKSATHDTSHDIYFTHGDLSPYSILSHGGKLSCLVDFGLSGFYPEYWEFTKGMYGHFGPDTSFIDMLSEAFEGSYQAEYQAEQRLWGFVMPW